MIIRILPTLNTRQQWIEFCRREVPYCFIENPDTLVDFQTSHLIITLLNRQVRNGKDAIKYSIGSRHSIEPAWNFIKASGFSLDSMVAGLETVDFQGNARDNSIFGIDRELNIRKFFAKEQAIISPAFLGPLDPLAILPPFWDLQLCCRALANGQYLQLRSEQQGLNNEAPVKPDSTALLLSIVEHPDHWLLRLRNQRLWLFQHRKPIFSFIPLLDQDSHNQRPLLERQVGHRPLSIGQGLSPKITAP